MKKSFHITIAALLLSALSGLNISAKSFQKKYQYNYERSWEYGDIKVTSKGKIEFNYDYTDVVMMGEEAYLKIA